MPNLCQFHYYDCFRIHIGYTCSYVLFLEFNGNRRTTVRPDVDNKYNIPELYLESVHITTCYFECGADGRGYIFFNRLFTERKKYFTFF